VEQPISGQKRKYIKWLRISGIVAGSLALILIIAGIAVQSRLERILLGEINKQLITRVEAGKISFSFFRSFPGARLTFYDIRIPTPGDPEQPLLEVASLAVHFSILDLIRKNYTIRYVEMRNGSLNILIPEAGDPNYLIFKPGDEEDSDDGISFRLRKFRIRDVECRFDDRISNISIGLHSTHTLFRGDFSSDTYRMRLGGGVLIRHVRTGDTRFFSGQQAVLDLSLDIDNITSTYTIHRGRMEVEGLPFRVTGSIVHGSLVRNLDLEVEGDRMKIAHLLNMFPGYGDRSGRDYTPSGQVSFEGSIRGSYAGNGVPVVLFRYGIDQGSVSHRPTKVSLNDIVTGGEYRYAAGESILMVNHFSARLGSGLIKLEGTIKDPKTPQVSFTLEADLKVEELLAFFAIPQIEKGSGQLGLHLQAETSLSLSEGFTVTHLMNSRTNGEVQLEDVSFVLTDGSRQFSNISGRMIFDNNDVRVTRLVGLSGSNELVFDGYFRNLLPYMLISGETLEFTGSLRSPMLNLKELLFGTSGSGTGTQGGGAVVLPVGVRGTLDVTAERMVYEDFTPSRVTGRLTLAPERIMAEQVRMDAFGGTLQGAVALVAGRDGTFHFDCLLNTSRADIHQLFRQFNNFGQQDLTHRHLEGLLTSRIRIQSRLTPGLIFMLPTIEAVGELMVESGVLRDYEPVKALAGYTRLDDLSLIRFNTLRNEIRIRNSEILIPEMMIRSDALDLSLSGTHTFDGRISYRFRILLSELLSRKARQVSHTAPDADLSDQDERGRLTLHLLVEGTVSNPVVRYDRRGQRRRVQEELRSEKEDLRQLFQKEFGTFSRESRRAERESARRDEGSIVIEWDDR
jgi:hypothetical protein